MNEITRFSCGTPGCRKSVKGIYCDGCRIEREERRAREREENELERRRMMKERWKNEREDMIAAIKAGKEKP